MDRFDLKWPKTDATFYTDGWRCRIVWRQKGGIGGTIENNSLCVRRLADSLEGAPYLLGALKARGHDRLATEIEALAGQEAAQGAEVDQTPKPAVPKSTALQPKSAERKPSTAERLTAWVDGLPGSDAFEEATGKRAKAWIELGELGDEALLLKTPAAKGNPEWVLKRTWPSAKRKAEYVAAPSFKGLGRYLIGQNADVGFIERLLGACEAAEHEELIDAARCWRSAMDSATH